MSGLRAKFATAVLSALADKGMTQKQLAIRCDLSEKHVSQVLTGVADGSFDTWQKFAQALSLRWDVTLAEHFAAESPR